MKQLSRRSRAWLIAGLVVVSIGGAMLWALLPSGATGFAGGRTVSLTAYEGPSPAGVPLQLRSADLVTRGEYLARVADCEVCHTREGGRRFAGGRAFETPFGVLYSPNITADQETGIGGWSDTDFLRALHEGIAKNGEHLYPAFPYESYTLITDEDALAIKAYLFSLPIAHAAASANSLRFPFNQRWLMGIWGAFYNPNQRFSPHADRSPQWNRGAYLTEALAHCGDCHTPRNLAQAPDHRRKFSGTIIGGWRAYNITTDPVSGIGAWSTDELAQYLREGHAVGHGPAGGPMAEEVDVSSSALVAEDMNAQVTYLRSVPAIRSQDLPAPKTAPASDWPNALQAAADSRGIEIYEGACASCHDWSGVSLLTRYATLTGDRAVSDPSAFNVVQIILSGADRQTSEGRVVMPAFADAYSDIEIAAVANYVTARFGAAPSQLTAADVARYRRSR